MGATAAAGKLVSRMRDEVGSARPDSAMGGEVSEADMDKYQLVFSRARHGRYEDIAKLLEEGVAVDGRDQSGNTFLMIAAQNGKTKVAKLAIKAKCNVNAQNGQGNTALHFCMAYGFRKMGETLLKAGADPTIRNRAGMTCYEGIDKRTKSKFAGPEGEESAPTESSQVVTNTSSDLALIKVEELTNEIKTLKMKLAEAEADKMLENDRLEGEVAALRREAQSAGSVGMKEAEHMKAKMQDQEAELTTAGDKIEELEKQCKTWEARVDDERAKMQEQEKKSAQVAELQAQEVGRLNTELADMTAQRDATQKQLEVLEEEKRTGLEEKQQTEAVAKKAAEDREKAAEEEGEANKPWEDKAKEYQNKWSVELMERKKLSNDVEVKTRRLDQAYNNIEMLEENKKNLEESLAGVEAAKAALEAQLAAEQSAHSASQEQVKELEGSVKDREEAFSSASAAWGQERQEAAKKLADAEQQVRSEIEAHNATKEALAAAEQDKSSAESAASGATESATRCKELEKELASIQEQLKAAAGNEAAAGRVKILEAELMDLKEDAARETREARQQAEEARDLAAVKEQEVVAEKAKAEEALNKAAMADQESAKMRTEGDSRAKMLQGCLDAERKRYSELEERFVKAQEDSAAAEQIKKESKELKAELDETKAKLATLWSQFLGGK